MRQIRILKSIAIELFLNSIEKNFDDKSGKIINRIAKAYTLEEKKYKTHKKDRIIPKRNYLKAIQTLL